MSWNKTASHQGGQQYINNLRRLVYRCAGTRRGFVTALFDANVIGTFGGLERLDPFLRVELGYYSAVNIHWINLPFVWSNRLRPRSRLGCRCQGNEFQSRTWATFRLIGQQNLFRRARRMLRSRGRLNPRDGPSSENNLWWGSMLIIIGQYIGYIMIVPARPCLWSRASIRRAIQTSAFAFFRQSCLSWPRNLGAPSSTCPSAVFLRVPCTRARVSSSFQSRPSNSFLSHQRSWRAQPFVLRFE